MDNEPGEEVNDAANGEEDVVAGDDVAFLLVEVEKMTGKDGKKDAADGAGHAADAGYGAEGAFGEHVGDDGEDVGTPCVVGCGGEAYEGDGGPAIVGVSGEDDGCDEQGGEEEGCFARFEDGPVVADEMGREEAAADAADGGGEVDGSELQAGFGKVEGEG